MAADETPKKGLFAGHSNSVAFVVEALLLLVALIAAMAVFTQLFAGSMTTAEQANRTTTAAVVAQNAAEEFSSDAAAVAAGQTVGAGVAKNGSDGFNVKCDVTSQKESTGTMYTAHITVSDSAGTAYELDTTHYVSGVR